MDEEEKREYLKKLSEDYIFNISNAKPMPKKKNKIFKVKFDFKKNNTCEFDKHKSVKYITEMSAEKKIEKKQKINKAIIESKANNNKKTP